MPTLPTRDRFPGPVHNGQPLLYYVRDVDGDRLRVLKESYDKDHAVSVVVYGSGNEKLAVYLTPEDVDRLRAALAPEGTKAVAAEDLDVVRKANADAVTEARSARSAALKDARAIAANFFGTAGAEQLITLADYILTARIPSKVSN